MSAGLLQSQVPLANEPLPSGGKGLGGISGLFQDASVVLGAGLVVLAVLLVWARFIRRSSRHRSDLRVNYPTVTEEEPAETSTSEGSDRHHQHRRRRRRDHRPRNPTLSETGGLPPPREHHELPPPV